MQYRNYPYSKMPRQQRAKQFMPFAALKSLDEALARQAAAVTKQYDSQISIYPAERQALFRK